MPKRSEQTNTILTLLVELEKGKKSGEEKGWTDFEEIKRKMFFQKDNIPDTL